MSDPSARTIWLDGDLVGWEDAQVHLLAHSLHYGMGIFEGLRSYESPGGASSVFRLGDHMNRFFESARLLGMELPFDRASLRAAVLEILRVNELREAYVRPIAFYGAGGMGLLPLDNPVHVAIAAYPYGTYLGDDALKRGIRTRVSSFRRPDRGSIMNKSKCSGSYVNSTLAKREASRDGYDEAILLDTEGFVAEGTGQNVFLVRHGALLTPPPGSILPGITRDTILLQAAAHSIPAAEQQLTRDMLLLADEVFLTGTASEVTPVVEVDRCVIGDGTPGPVTRHLQQAYFELVRGQGDGSHPPDWLSSVSPTAAARS